MGEKIKKKFIDYITWINDGLDFKEFLGLLIIIIFGYIVYFSCKKMMSDVGLAELDIEFLKIVTTNLIIVLVFYFGSNSVEGIIKVFFNNKSLNKKDDTQNNNENIIKY